MKKILTIFGAVFLLLLIVSVIGFALLAKTGNALDKESKQYVDTVIPKITSTWNKQSLIEHASPEFMQSINSNDLDKLINIFQKLGKLKSYNGANGQANISVTPQNGKIITAAYSGKADFESGPAEIQVNLIKHGDKWQILGFRINSRALLE